MRTRSLCSRAGLILSTLAIAGCSHQRAAEAERLALLPATVLIGDPSQEWLANAVPIVLQQDLATSGSLIPSLAPNASAAYGLQATQLLRAVVEQRNGRFRIQATVVAAKTQQNREVIEQEGPVSGGVIPLLDALAKRLDPAGAGAFSTRKDEALKAFTAAVGAPDAAGRRQFLEASVQADPGFGLGQIARVENAPQAAETGPVAVDAFVPLDRARWSALSARLHHAPLNEQAKAQAAVVALAPNNVEALAALGFDRFLQGNGAEGEKWLRQAISLSGSNSALSVQLAEGFVAVRKFAEAAGILRALSANSPNLLPPLALVELLAGNPEAADQTFKRFLSFFPSGNAAIPTLETQWQHFRNPDLPGAAIQTPEFWQSVVTQSGDTNLAARAMLASALDHAGRLQEASDIQVKPFIPEFTDPNAPAAFNEMRRRIGLSAK